MALYSVDHSVGIARDLADRLSLRLSNGSGLNFVRQTQDAQGWPELFISHGGNEAEGQPVVFIRISNLNVGAIDIFGNSTYPFTPTQTQIAYELNSAGAPIPTTQDYSTCLFEVTRMGTVVQQIAVANGTAVTFTSVEAATPVQTLADIDWSLKGNT
jgi:hypothetical protein